MSNIDHFVARGTLHHRWRKPKSLQASLFQKKSQAIMDHRFMWPRIWSLLTSRIAILLITLLTVGFQAAKAALANPVKSLRSE